MTSFGMKDEDLVLLHLRPLAHDPGDNVHCESHKQDSPQPVVEDFSLENCCLGALFADIFLPLNAFGMHAVSHPWASLQRNPPQKATRAQTQKPQTRVINPKNNKSPNPKTPNQSHKPNKKLEPKPRSPESLLEVPVQVLTAAPRQAHTPNRKD